jgi:hypothetical protein
MILTENELQVINDILDLALKQGGIDALSLVNSFMKIIEKVIDEN